MAHFSWTILSLLGPTHPLLLELSALTWVFPPSNEVLQGCLFSLILNNIKLLVYFHIFHIVIKSRYSVDFYISLTHDLLFGTFGFTLLYTASPTPALTTTGQEKGGTWNIQPLILASLQSSNACYWSLSILFQLIWAKKSQKTLYFVIAPSWRSRSSDFCLRFQESRYTHIDVCDTSRKNTDSTLPSLCVSANIQVFFSFFQIEPRGNFCVCLVSVFPNFLLVA